MTHNKRFRNTAIRATALFAFLLITENIYSQKSPTDVFYLAKTIDNSITESNGLTSTFSKERFSENLNPRNVFQKAVALVEEFNTIYPGAADLGKCTEIEGSVDLAYVTPSNVYQVLSLIQYGLGDVFVEYGGEKTPQKPSDVFQQLRHISSHLKEVATLKKIDTKKLYVPSRVYEANLTNLMPIVYAIAKQQGVSYSDFSFTAKPAAKKPKDVYATITSIFESCAQYYSNRMGYEAVTLNKIADTNSIEPADVFDLTGIVLGELKGQADGDAKLETKILATYKSWAKSRKIIPGDVFNLVSYMNDIAKQFN